MRFSTSGFFKNQRYLDYRFQLKFLKNRTLEHRFAEIFTKDFSIAELQNWAIVKYLSSATQIFIDNPINGTWLFKISEFHDLA